MIQSLRDSSGQWRALDADTMTGGLTRVYLGRDKTWSPLQVDIIGKKLVGLLATRLPQADTYHRRHDNTILMDWKPVIKIEEVDAAAPTLRWNKQAMTALKLSKEELVAELGQAGARSAGQVAWES